MLMPSIVVIVPVYNRAKSVLSTLESVAAQTQPPLRLVVVDDGSRDGSAESVETWVAARRPPFETRVIRKLNGGVSSARNRAIADCGDCAWFAFLDSDDVWPADFLARASAALAENPAAVAASADRLFVDDSTATTRPYAMHELAAYPILWMMRHGAAISSCSVVRADLVRQLGGFLEHLPTGEDAALYLPLSLRGPWLHLPGQPVSFVRRLSHAGGEETSLSRKFTDNQRRWARVFESFLAGLTPDERLQVGNRTKVRRLMANRWALAGQELERNGHVLEATTCYARAVHWRPGKWDRWRALLRTPFRAVFGLATAAA